jgi:hypothetical protein
MLKRRLFDSDFDESSGKIAEFSFKEMQTRKHVKTFKIMKRLCLFVISYHEEKQYQ